MMLRRRLRYARHTVRAYAIIYLPLLLRYDAAHAIMLPPAQQISRLTRYATPSCCKERDDMLPLLRRHLA